MVGIVLPPRNRKGGAGNPPPTGARASALPDPDCRLFLSSEAGGVGLNLQVADTVINMDQPWNPARLDQRIARAWRKHQHRTVRVFNLVSEDTIEHRMLGLLDAKRTLAEGVLDRRGDIANIPLPTSRTAFMERLKAVLGTDSTAQSDEATAPTVSPTEALRDRLIADHGGALSRIFGHENGTAILAVIDLPADKIGEEEKRLAALTDLTVTVIDPATHESMMRLAQSGLIPSPTETMEEIFPVPGEREDAEERANLLRARALADRADHRLKAAQLLAGGGFAEEARVPAVDAIRLTAGSLAAMTSGVEPEDAEEAAAYLAGLEPGGEADGIALDAVRVLSGDTNDRDPVETAAAFLNHVSSRIARSPDHASR